MSANPAAANSNQANIMAEPQDSRPFRIHFSACGAEEADLGKFGDTLLGAVTYGDLKFSPNELDVPVFHVPLPAMQGGPRAKVYCDSTSRVERGGWKGVQYGCGQHVLFGGLKRTVDTGDALEEISEEMYGLLLEFLRESRYSNLLRVWNYVPCINENSRALENYKRFCMGRQRAFEARIPDFERTLPAACALGRPPGEMVVLFLAAPEAGLPVENPRQVSAYRYPPEYGPRSPSFSRAMLKALGGEQYLFLSGTSSVVGHETVGRGDLARQLDETMRNISSIIRHIQDGDTSRELFSPRYLTAYVRHVRDVPTVRKRLEREFGNLPVMYLQADVCRSELLLEIEGMWSRAAREC